MITTQTHYDIITDIRKVVSHAVELKDIFLLATC